MPDSFTLKEFAVATLKSADTTDRVQPPQLVDFFRRMSWLFSLAVDDLIVNRSRHDEPMRWFITDKGREWLAAHNM